MKTNSRYSKIMPRIFTSPMTVVVALPFIFSCNRGPDTGYTVLKGTFTQSVIETGELQAVNASFLSMPRINMVYGYNFKIVGLAGHGTNVRKGDPVIKVDPSSVQKYIIERGESLENELAAANKLRAQLTNSVQELKAQLKNEQASYDIKKLEVERSAFESASLRKVIELEFRQAQIRLDKIKRNLELRPKLDSLDLRIQNIKIKQKENELRAAKNDLTKLTVLSPLDGVFVVEENWRNGQMIKVGDEVYLGSPVARIPDIRTMKVKGFVMENDISRMKTGLDVIIRLDALPSVAFHGKVRDLGRVCIERDENNVFPTEVIISESDLRLKPGMTVSCEYITWQAEEQIHVPNACLLEENRHYYLFIKRRGKIRKTEVVTGPSNNMYTVVSGEIRPGQELVLPADIENR